jgi:hypothetical protein
MSYLNIYVNDSNLGAEHGEKRELLITYLGTSLFDYCWITLDCFKHFLWPLVDIIQKLEKIHLQSMTHSIC